MYNTVAKTPNALINNPYSQKETINNQEICQVVKIVDGFGSKLKNVPLLAPKEIIIKYIKDNYSIYVIDRLLEKWIKEPKKAPGRLTSSPWPDRIEIKSINKIDKYTYKVTGEIIEITSSEIVLDGVAAKRPIVL
ncbi:MAG: hypothetical protein JG776_581 [Caloramator sp.]|uniref:hypothetical protein n=1 Tax=Caloramator sp. TaxID=1871330 RepID=UPI001D64131B|nr:hypothetical protein [Caloramator sp.]MBZ4662899.1 hypothetical protein [Caloramator sp.]